MTYVGIIRGRSTGKNVTTEFTLLGSLDVQISKGGGGVQRFLVIYVKQRKQRTLIKSFCALGFIRYRSVPLGYGPYDPYGLRQVTATFKDWFPRWLRES
jgi:hypothetical protein